MSCFRCFGFAACLLLALPGAVKAEDEDYEMTWSASIEAAFHKIASHEANDDVTGFFDQYQFTPNKDDAGGLEIGLTAAKFDLLGGEETPIVRFRLASPTSNLGLGQSDADHPFLNQRAVLVAKHRGFFLDLQYRRMRTEKLRQFPNPAGSALTFTDLTDPGQRFYKERTGFDGTLRFRPQETFAGLPRALSALDGELELRGGYEVRKGKRQDSFLLSPTNDWLSLQQSEDQEVGTIGGGFQVVPGGLFTLALDVDYQRFREDESTLTDAALGAPFPSSTQTINFVPDTDRTTGTLRIRRRFGQRADVRGAVQVSYLEQVSGETPEQRSVGFGDNYVLSTSVDLATDIQILGGFSTNAFFKYDERDNHIDRDSALFNPGGGSQVDEFLDHWRRILAGAEIVYAFQGRNRVSLGAKAEWVDRDLDFVPVPLGQRILPANALVSDETEMVTVYGRTRLRPFQAFEFRGEIGYRDAPKTGYVVDLDDYVYGSANASYTLPVARPVVLSAFARGSTGENRDFNSVDGLGPVPAGARVDRHFERREIHWGVSVTASPWKNLTVFSSFFQSREDEDYDLIRSDLPRYFQDVIALTFMADAPVHYRSDDIGVLTGANVRIDERTDAGVTYAFTRVKSRYGTGGPTPINVKMINATSKIEADIHRVGATLDHRLREGLSVTGGYRLDIYNDRSPVNGAGIVQPFDLGTYQHTVTLGITISNEFWD
jgi:hypothetical protein